MFHARERVTVREHGDRPELAVAPLDDDWGKTVRLQQPTERQDPRGKLSAQPAAGFIGVGEPVGGDQQRGVFGDFLGCQGAERGSLIQEETIVFRVSEVAVGAGAGGGITGAAAEEELDQAELLHLVVHEYGHALVGRLRAAAGTRQPKTIRPKTPGEVAAIWAYEAADEFRCDLFSNALVGQCITVTPSSGGEPRRFTLADLLGLPRCFRRSAR
ncbi:hypothetical protein [Streptomyces sp. ISL-44]|uniref:hypothetical protein n=1 Tax=Streptomyces sp. ISL-44 TaxID=2819184 RepID=UPI001BEBC9D7|nr:hypothetical protein [Streptomyces sp. ISL-44]